MKANNEVARKFQDLVCDEILPSIRKNGGYILTNEQDDEDSIMARALLIAQKTLEKHNQRIKQLEIDNQVKDQQLAEYKPIIEYVDTILNSEDTLAITQIAADYDLSAKALNNILHENKLIRKVGGQWILYIDHMNKGYTKSKTIKIQQSSGEKVVLQTRWTQKGRLKIHEILTSLGIKAVMDKMREVV